MGRNNYKQGPFICMQIFRDFSLTNATKLLQNLLSVIWGDLLLHWSWFLAKRDHLMDLSAKSEHSIASWSWSSLTHSHEHDETRARDENANRRWRCRLVLHIGRSRRRCPSLMWLLLLLRYPHGIVQLDLVIWSNFRCARIVFDRGLERSVVSRGRCLIT